MMRRIFNNQYFRNVVTLTIGSSIGYGVIVAVSPLLTRLYSPEQLGSFALMMAVVNMLSPVINGHYEFQIVSVGPEVEAATITVTSMFFGLAFTLVSAVALAVFSSVRMGFAEGAFSIIFYAIPLLIIAAIVTPLSNYNNRHKQYRLLASMTVIRTTTQAVGQVLLGFGRFGVGGLIAAQILSSVVGVKRQARVAWDNRAVFQAVTWKQVTLTLRRYYKQPLYSASALLLCAFAYSSVIFIMGNLYGLREVGYYSLTFSLLGLPLTLVTRNVASVFLQKAGHEKTISGHFTQTYRHTLGLLAVISIPTFGVLMCVSEPLFGLLFGKGWERAGYFVKILCPMFALRFMATSLEHALFIANRQRTKFMLQLSFPLEVFAAYCLTRAWNCPADQFLMMVSALFSVSYVGLAWFSWRASCHHSPPFQTGTP